MLANAVICIVADGVSREISEVQAILDFPPPSDDFIYRFVVGWGVSPEFALSLFAETKKFLVLCASEPVITDFTPSHWVDTMWQHFMRWPEQYRRFCEAVGQPSGLQRRVHLMERDVRYGKTRRRLADLFGECDEKFWHPQDGDLACCTASVEV